MRHPPQFLARDPRANGNLPLTPPKDVVGPNGQSPETHPPLNLIS